MRGWSRCGRRLARTASAARATSRRHTLIPARPRLRSLCHKLPRPPRPARDVLPSHYLQTVRGGQGQPAPRYANPLRTRLEPAAVLYAPQVDGSSGIANGVHSMAVSLVEDALLVATEASQLYTCQLGKEDPVKGDDQTKLTLLSQSFHSSAVTSVDSCVRKPLVVTASTDRSVRVWNYVDRVCELSKVYTAQPPHDSHASDSLRTASCRPRCSALHPMAPRRIASTCGGLKRG